MPALQTEVGMVRVPPGTWNVDPSHSSVAFEVKHLMISTVRGHFREFEGTIEAAEDDPSNSRCYGSVTVASIDTGDAQRDEHLRSPDFFDAENYPEITFESTRIQHVEDNVYRMAGNLTIRGQTLEVEFDASVEGAAEDPWGNERVGISVRGEVDRTQFGLTWQQRLAAGGMMVGETVKVLIDASAVRAAD
jgi:polyisoprenoid-binding protein YceI